MRLVFMRHGKAEDHGVRFTDEDRELTLKGRQKIKAVTKGIKQLLLPKAQLQIWSSPLPRARQTAQILAKRLGRLPVQEHAEIHTGELANLIQKWTGLAPDTTLVIVGHEPYLSQWAERISGVTLSFKKASAAGFTLTSPQEGELVWFLQAKMLAGLACKKGVAR